MGKHTHCVCVRDYSVAHNLHCFMVVVAKFVICSCVNVLPVRLQWQQKIQNFRNVGEQQQQQKYGGKNDETAVIWLM